jgi:hypothetical protein
MSSCRHFGTPPAEEDGEGKNYQRRCKTVPFCVDNPGGATFPHPSSAVSTKHLQKMPGSQVDETYLMPQTDPYVFIGF